MRHSNKRGYHCPGGCKLPDSPRLPEIAVPCNTKGGFEDTYLATRNTLHNTIACIVIGSPILKAWFVLRLPHAGLSGENAQRYITLQWGPLWKLMQEQGVAWDRKYIVNHDKYKAQWELHKLSSEGELYALAMFVLFRKASKPPRKDDKRKDWLEWHRYYHDEERKFFLLCNFLIFYSRTNSHAAPGKL